jgi:hypothetical protein
MNSMCKGVVTEGKLQRATIGLLYMLRQGIIVHELVVLPKLQVKFAFILIEFKALSPPHFCSTCSLHILHILHRYWRVYFPWKTTWTSTLESGPNASLKLKT